MIRNRREADTYVPIWRREHPAVFSYRFCSVCHGRSRLSSPHGVGRGKCYAMDGGDFHPLTGSGEESVPAVLMCFMSELFSVTAIRRAVRCRFSRGAHRGLPDPVGRRVLRRRYTIAIHAIMISRQGIRVFLRVIRAIRNRWEAYACGHGPRFAVRSRPLGYTAVPLSLSWIRCRSFLAFPTTPPSPRTVVSSQ